jgi:hypothetical protein
MSVGLEHSTGAGSDAWVAVERYRPPFVLTSDMLFVMALAPTRHLQRSFPGVPFVSILGRTPLVVWFSRITESCYHDQAGEWRCERSSSPEGIYSEVTVLGLLRQQAVFGPAIYASDVRTVQIGRRYYGMPKQLAQTDVRVGEARFEGTLIDDARPSFVHARLFGGGRGVGAVVARLWPRWTWPVHFPSGGHVRALILATPRLQVARIHAGQIAVQTPWLRAARPLLPIGLYVGGLRIQLPSSEERTRLHAAAQRWPC